MISEETLKRMKGEVLEAKISLAEYYSLIAKAGGIEPPKKGERFEK